MIILHPILTETIICQVTQDLFKFFDPKGPKYFDPFVRAPDLKYNGSYNLKFENAFTWNEKHIKHNIIKTKSKVMYILLLDVVSFLLCKIMVVNKIK